MRFSIKSSSGYPERLKYKTPPDDIQTITDAEHRVLMDGIAAGKVVVAGPDGKPALADRPPPDPAIALRAAAQTALIGSHDAILQFVEDGVPVPPEWAAYRKAVRALSVAQTGSITDLPGPPASAATTSPKAPSPKVKSAKP